MNHEYTATAERHGRSSADAELVADLPLPDVFKRFGTDVSTLVRQEIALAKTELAKQAPKVGQSIALFAIAAVLGIGAFFALTLTLIAAIALALPLWAAALIVTVSYVVIAAIAALRGKSNLKGVGDPIPHALENLRLDVEVVKAGFGRGR
ncbi:MAG: hypothetical protein NVS2B8_20310 [Vulcanimicrobiaceae bacterium]